MARPSTFTDEVFDAILARLARGTPLATMCREEGMPDPDTVRNWLKDNTARSARYAQARADGFDAIAADALEIIDTPEMGEVVKVERELVPLTDEEKACEAHQPGSVVRTYREVVVERRREDMLGHRRLKFEGRLKLLAKWDPKRYGERLALEHDISDNLADRMKAARDRARRS